MELTKEIITWIAVFIGTSLSSVVIAILSWIKAAKMMPKELKGSDLDNKIKEANIAEQMDELATKAADKAIKSQERLDKLEADYEIIEKKVKEQDGIIQEQANTIVKQSARLDLQERKILEQEEEITLLKCELNNAQSYNQALIAQMKEKNIIPIEFEATFPEDCKESLERNKKIKAVRKSKKEQQ